MNPPLSLPQAPRLRADRARQVADVLRSEVLADRYAEGLPAEGALVAEFATTRNTIRVALDLLRAEGLIARSPGVGTTVVGHKHAHGLDRLQGLAEVFEGRGEVHNEVRALTMTRPPSAVREALQLGPDDEVLYVERLRHLDGIPLSLDLSYLVPDLGARLLGRDLATHDLFALLEDVAGQPLGHADLVLEAVAADPHSAAVLGSPWHAPLLMAERLTHLADGRPVDVEFIRFRGDRITLRGTTRRRPEETR